MIKVAVPGVNGRMGQAVAAEVLSANDLQLVLASVRADNQLLGSKVANSDVVITTGLQDINFDVLIDFTLPAGVIEHVEYCRQHNNAMVIGATGFNAEQLQIVQSAAQHIPILLSSNMSVGVNKAYKLIAYASKMFANDWEASVIDIHHKHKKDSPSGTAKQIAKIIADNAGMELEDIGMHSERQGETIGEHAVIFSNEFEQVIISHISQDRRIYAQGAVIAARWLVQQKPGLYSMLDVI